jgi:hypothetical protein
MELAPAFYLSVEEVAKASQGHDPLPFLISITCKELVQRYKQEIQTSKFIF